jgi:hypothetical protein
MSERAIFLAALDKDPAERAAFLDEACAGSEALRRGVETLLRLNAAPHRFLEVPAIEQLAAAVPGRESAAADLSFLGPPSEPGSLGRLDHYEVPGALCRLIERLHAKTPTDRPASAQEVAEMLSGMLAGLQPAVAEAGSSPAAGRGRQASRGGVAGSAVSVV